MHARPADDHFKDRIRNWVKLLSQKRFEDAIKLLAPSPFSDIDTVEEIKICIGLYNRHFVPEYEAGRIIESLIPGVSDPFAMALEGEQFRFHDDEDGIYVLYELPLDGEWSDLSAEFQFIPSGGEYIMALLQIHVL